MTLQEPQGMARLNGAASLLLMLCSMLKAEHTEGLAVALVGYGLLEAAAQHSALWADGKRRKDRVVKVGRGVGSYYCKWNLLPYTSLQFRRSLECPGRHLCEFY